MYHSMTKQRTKVFQLRLTPEEAALLKEKSASYSSVSHYIRSAVAEYSNMDVKKKLELINDLGLFYRKFQNELSWAGGNLNQSVKRANELAVAGLLALTQNEDPETSIYDALVKDKPFPIVPIRRNLDLVPASLDLARAEIDMATMMAREGILKSHLDRQKEKYDYILMDCSPSLGIVTTNALVAADKLYIPLTAEALPLKGLTMLGDIVCEVKRRVNPKLELGGVFFTRFNNRKLNKEVMNMVKNRYGDKVFQTKIRENIAIAEMPLSGQTLFEYDPKSNGAADYRTLTEEIIRREENR